MTMANAMNVNSTQVISLNYSHKYSVEEYYDFCIAEVSNANDTSWQPVKSYTGILSNWKNEIFDITEYAAG